MQHEQLGIVIRNILGQPKNSIDSREVMDGGKILLADVLAGRIGEDVSSFLRSLIVARLRLAAMSRIDILSKSGEATTCTPTSFSGWS